MDNTTKARATKEFFPNIKDRLKNKINITPNFTAFVTAHGKTKAYLHRFNIIESRSAPAVAETKQLTTSFMTAPYYRTRENASLGKISRLDNWPVHKHHLVNKCIKYFLQFTNAIDFNKL
jgi:hypothetical protein